MSLSDKLLLRISPQKIIERSSYFDAQWYGQKYDVRKDAALHYLNEGWKLNYNPSARFSTRDYLINNPDIRDINPLLHYEVFGRHEGRKAFIPPVEKTDDHTVNRVSFSCEDYYENINDKSLISFDVFDTLVSRPFIKADDLFLYIENRYDIQGFARDRIKAEKDARSILKKEVSLEEIYDHIDERYRRYRDIEIETEIALCHRHDGIWPLYEYARKMNRRVIAVSDMYHSRDTIRRILERSGYQMDEIYVSCEFDKTKGNGDLYEYVLNAEGIDKKDMIHFGDNYLSDYSQARLMDIEAYQTPTVSDICLSDEDNRAFLSFLNKHDSLAVSIYLSLISRSRQSDDHFEKLGYLFGGPLALGYLDFVCDSAQKDNIDRLLFVSRDGYSLIDIYEKYFYGRYHIDHAYAYLSRAAIYAGSIANGLNDDLKKLLKIVSLDIKEIGASDDDDICRQEYEKYRDQIDELSIRRSDNLKMHLLNICEGSDNVATVDMVSSRFTSFKGGRYYLGDRLRKGYFAGSFSSISDEYSFYGQRLLGMRDNLPVKLSEILISSPESSVIGVDENGKAVYEGPADRQREERYLSIIKGMHEYCDDFISYFEINKGLLLDFDEWIDLAGTYLNECSDDDVNALADVIDSADPVSGKHDRSFKELIEEYRNKGY